MSDKTIINKIEWDGTEVTIKTCDIENKTRVNVYMGRDWEGNTLDTTSIDLDEDELRKIAEAMGFKLVKGL